MVSLEESPLLWTLQFSFGLFLLFLLLLIPALETLYLFHSTLPHTHKLTLAILTFCLIAPLSSFIFNPSTHIIGCMLCAYATIFTSPLNAISVLESSHPDRVQRPGVPPMLPLEILLRVSIPAAHPSMYHHPRPPRTQLLRGLFFLLLAANFRHVCLYVIRPEVEGLLRDVGTFLFLYMCADGVFNTLSSLLGFLGFPSPAPFRNPFCSSSMAAFWAGEWNAPVSDAMRGGIYQPLYHRGVRKDVAAFMCFVYSALVHELVFVFCRIYDSPMQWLIFFLAAGVACAVERLYLDKIPRSVVRAIGVVVLYSLYHLFFVPPTVSTGLAEAAAKGMGAGVILFFRLCNVVVDTVT